MPAKTNPIPKEKRSELTDLLIKGARNEDAAKAVDLPLNRVTYFRAKLVAAGVVERQRTRRTKAAIAADLAAKAKAKARAMKPATPVLKASKLPKAVEEPVVAPATLFPEFTGAPEPIFNAEEVTTATLPFETQDLTNVLGDMFVFRINNMEVQISDATRVHVQKGMIEIKY